MWSSDPQSFIACASMSHPLTEKSGMYTNQQWDVPSFFAVIFFLPIIITLTSKVSPLNPLHDNERSFAFQNSAILPAFEFLPVEVMVAEFPVKQTLNKSPDHFQIVPDYIFITIACKLCRCLSEKDPFMLMWFENQ